MSEKSFGELLIERLSHWQRVLRLQDWTVGVTVARYGALPGAPADALAACELYPHRKDAIITVLHPMDLGSVSRFYIGDEARDYDLTLVHELLRLHFMNLGVSPGTKEDLAQEQVLGALSRAVVNMYRESHPIKPQPSHEPSLEEEHIMTPRIPPQPLESPEPVPSTVGFYL